MSSAEPQRSSTPLPPRDRSGQWQAALVLAPLLLLAVLGWRGLQASRASTLATARAESERLLEWLRQDWQQVLSALPEEWPLPEMYADPPAPAAHEEAQDLFTQAMEAPPDKAAEMLQRLSEGHRNARASTGVPLLPLVLWAQLQRVTSPPETDEIAGRLVQAAVGSHPSVLTNELLERAEPILQERGASTGLVAQARERWARDENVRTLLRRHAAAPRVPPRPWLRGDAGTLWWHGDGTLLVPRAHLDSVAADLQTAAKRNGRTFPPGVAVFFALDGEELSSPSAEGEEMAHTSEGPISISARLTNPAALYAQEHQRTLWMAALLVSALAAVLAGFWLLRRSIARERQLNAMKSNFVASVSHELRAPIASMRVMAENLESGVVKEDSRRDEYHRLISEECRRLSALIDNVLDFARIEQNRKSYHFAETEIHALVQDAISLMQARASQRQQKITSQLELIEPPPLCDGAAIQQALINLLDNAIKFSAAGLEILVRVRKGSADTWELAVVDQGVGIARAEHLRIFERFYRVGSELCRETQGAGIGLSIVQHVAAGHCGSVAVESEPGAGATFTLSLPLNPERK